MLRGDFDNEDYVLLDDTINVLGALASGDVDNYIYYLLAKEEKDDEDNIREFTIAVEGAGDAGRVVGGLELPGAGRRRGGERGEGRLGGEATAVGRRAGGDRGRAGRVEQLEPRLLLETSNAVTPGEVSVMSTSPANVWVMFTSTAARTMVPVSVTLMVLTAPAGVLSRMVSGVSADGYTSMVSPTPHAVKYAGTAQVGSAASMPPPPLLSRPSLQFFSGRRQTLGVPVQV